MNSIFGCFDKAFCIYLESRFDRNSNAQSQFNSINLKNIDFIQGKEPKQKGPFKRPGTFGCYLSHMDIFHLAKKDDLDSFVVFEDDVVFEKHFLVNIEPILEDLKNQDWDIFYLFSPRKGSHDIKKNRGEILKNWESGLVKTTGSILTHAYAVNCKCLDILLEKLSQESIRNLPLDIRPIDKSISNLNLNYYGCSSDLTYQNPDIVSSIKLF
jgi:hypothetical protein